MLKIIRWRFYNSVWKYFIFHISIWHIFFWHRKHIAHIRIFLVQPLNNIVCFKNRHTLGLTWQQTSTKLKLGYVSQKIMVCKEVYGSSSVCKKYVKKEKDTLSTIDLSPKWTSISQFFTVVAWISSSLLCDQERNMVFIIFYSEMRRINRSNKTKISPISDNPQHKQKPNKRTVS